MFTNERYLTCGIDNAIPLALQLFMWECVERLPEQRDYLQVFELKASGPMQSISHRSEDPEHHMEYMIPYDEPITAKVFIIDDGDHSTMLLAEEY